MVEKNHEADHEGSSGRDLRPHHNTGRRVMDDTYVSRFQEFCHPASGRPAITSSAGRSVVGFKITGFVLVCLLCLGLGSQLVRGGTALPAHPPVRGGPPA